MRASLDYARSLDQKDRFLSYRHQFAFPQHEGRPVVYLSGNSLGLMPKSVPFAMDETLRQWADQAVEGHFKGKHPWMYYHETVRHGLTALAGAKPAEVTAMNSLTTNLHLLMAGFYKPKGKRTKILMESWAFSSDRYAITSQLEYHGCDPATDLVEVQPDPDTHLFTTEHVISLIKHHADELALVCLGGVNYLTGQLLDIQSITAAAHEHNIPVGWDLAHATGNVALQLHDWQVDFAVWCSYKYLNSGPGAIAGAFVHEQHHDKLPAFRGWWGHDPATRFDMPDTFVPAQGSDAWQLSNPSVLSIVPLRMSLYKFQEAGMDALCEKRKKAVAYLRFLLNKHPAIKNITPENAGCQQSLVIQGADESLQQQLRDAGIVIDARKFGDGFVLRAAPVPLYNSFEDIFRFYDTLTKLL